MSSRIEVTAACITAGATAIQAAVVAIALVVATKEWFGHEDERISSGRYWRRSRADAYRSAPGRRRPGCAALAKIFNPIIRGWIMYYGRYHKSALSRALMHLDLRLACWAMSKYRRLRGHCRRARYRIQDIRRREPILFGHWPLLYRAPVGQ
jgi:hypothetical protein